jgi:hypothetical protein
MTQQHTLADAARIRAPGDAAATSSDAVDAIFADLLCADSDLLRLEFDAITATLPRTGTGQRHRCPPTRRPQVTTSRRRPPVDPVGPGPTTAGPPRVRPTAFEPRERSPPATVGTLRPTSRR